MINTRLKPVTTGLIGAVGLGVALLGMPEGAKATTVVVPGTDYLFTPADSPTKYTFSDLSTTVYFKGLPLILDKDGDFVNGTDTIVLRTQPVPVPGGTTPIIIDDLSLVSISPVSIGGSSFDVFAGLDPTQTSTGEMTINHDVIPVTGRNGIWSSTFDLHATAVIVPTGTSNSSTARFVPNLIAQYRGVSCDFNSLPLSTPCTISFHKPGFVATNDPWSHTPEPNTFVGPDASNFFLVGDQPTFHETPDGSTHTVDPPRVPEPSTVLGLIAVGLSSIVGFKGKKEPK